MDRDLPKEIRRKNLRKTWYRILAVTGFIFTAVILIVKFSGDSVSRARILVSEVDRGPIEFTVGATGRVTPLTEYIIVSPVSSRIVEQYRKIGDTVTAGEPLLGLELSSLRTEYGQKLDELEMKKNHAEQADIKMHNSISELEMQRKVKQMQSQQLHSELVNEIYLDSIGASTPDKIRQAKLNHEVSVLELEQLLLRITNEKAAFQAEKKVSELEMEIFRKTIEQTGRLLREAGIISPITGVVTSLEGRIGLQVGEGTQVAVVSDLENYKVEAEIADAHATKLVNGSRATLKVSRQELDGIVTDVTPAVTNGTVKFTVMLTEPGHPALRSGQRADIHVQHGSRDDVLRIPNSSVYRNRGKYILWVIDGDRAYKRNVVLGDSSFEYVEVLEGLREGERVILTDMQQYNNNRKLRIK